MPIVDAYAQRKYQQVMRETWGHLAPEPRRVYTGYIVFAYGAWGDIVPLQCDFVDLESSPWFFEDLMDFIEEQIKDEDRGKVFRFEGTYTKFKNGNYRFSGKVKSLAAGLVLA